MSRLLIAEDHSLFRYTLRGAAAALALLMLAACAARAPEAAGGVTYVIVRHAEKGTDNARDPSLSATGQLRAQALARQWATPPLIAAYATAFKRTQQTALPAATASGINITTYEASQPARDFVAELRHAQPRGTILVVGHSNTVPHIVAALCACTIAPLGENDYDHLYEVRIDGAGHATLTQRKY